MNLSHADLADLAEFAARKCCLQLTHRTVHTGDSDVRFVRFVRSV